MNHDHSNGMSKHMLMMLICCLVPLVLILAVSVFGFSLGSVPALLPYVLSLLCPLMMIFMMRGMMQDDTADRSPHHVDAPRAAPTRRLAGNPKNAAELATRSREH